MRGNLWRWKLRSTWQSPKLVHQEIISGEGQMAFAFRLTLKIIRSDWLPIPITKLFSKTISGGWADDVTLKIMPSLGLVSAHLQNCFEATKITLMIVHHWEAMKRQVAAKMWSKIGQTYNQMATQIAT